MKQIPARDTEIQKVHMRITTSCCGSLFFLPLSLRRFDYSTGPVAVNTTAGFIPTAAAGIGPAPPVSKTGVLTFTPSRRDNGEGRTHDHGVAVRCLGLLATLSCTPVGTRIRISALGEPGAFLLHYRSIASVEGLEPSPCGCRRPVPYPFGDTDKYL